jgi:hypothetical protein
VILWSLDDRAPDFGGYRPASVELSQRSRTTQRLAPPGRVARQAEMATEPENPRLAGRHLQVLRVLADAPHGCDVNALLTRGVKLETMADLIQGELATVRVETHGRARLEDRVCLRPHHGCWAAGTPKATAARSRIRGSDGRNTTPLANVG